MGTVYWRYGSLSTTSVQSVPGVSCIVTRRFISVEAQNYTFVESFPYA